MKIITLYLTIFFILAGCSGQQSKWQKSDGSLRGFTLDEIECDNIATMFARAESANGNRVIPEFYELKKNECLSQKGWLPQSSGKTNQALPSSVTKLDNNTLSGFGLSLILPESTHLRLHKKHNASSTLMSQYFCQTPNNSYLNIIFQQSLDSKFIPAPYPVNEPFVEYASGFGTKSGIKLRWAIFAGKTGDEWVMGLGSYYMVNEEQRLIVVATSPLAPPEQEIPAGFHLARNQQLEIDRFSRKWLFWLNSQLPAEDNKNKKLKTFLKKVSRKFVISL